MHREWLSMEHYRMHLMELWPDGPRKEAGLAAARSALASLTRGIPKSSSLPCLICGSRQPIVTMISHVPRRQTRRSGRAA